ncbi:MAG: tetratricopeptide repeat protein [Myxococcota bacterium]
MKALGEARPDVATSRNNLAIVLEELGDDAGAEALLRQADASE